MTNRSRAPEVLTLFVCLLSLEAFAQASSGVSDERVNLPNAPGSISGVGENASVSGNQGGMSYAVQVEVPQGFPGVTPNIDFQYSSSGGSTVLGMGWAMDDFSIERMTSKGLQSYDLEDRFVVDGSDELVRVAQSANSVTYRSRFESGFVRYTWLNPGAGAGGTWKAEFPDGRVGYYGGDEAGASVVSAQVIVPGSSPAKVFRWHLVVMLDRFNHPMRLSWTPDPGGARLLDRVDYLYEAGQPRHSVRFTYEGRQDLISDAKPGFELKLTQRLQDVRIFSGAEVIRSYSMSYEQGVMSGGASRLSRVARLGRGGVMYPVTFNFGYSQTLGGACTTDCQKPFVTSAGTVAADFGNGRATLLDINGDALPDVLASSATGIHSFYYARLDGEGRTSFNATPVLSARTVGSTAFILGDPAVQVIDVNGDGFVDIAAPKGPALLCNNGSGDWVASSFCTTVPDGGVPALPADYNPVDDASDSAQQDPKFSRFFDYDNDKRIDWLQTASGGAGTTVLRNTPTGFVPLTVDNIGWVFDESSLQLADMNGDGLQDPVLLETSGSNGSVRVSYRLNLGFGRWGAIVSLSVAGFGATAAALAELQDINGDTLADLVAVVDGEVRLALNRNGQNFDAARTLTTAALGSGAIPARGTAQVSFADMNGNGSSDIVWIQANGAISYLELFPVRPNLLTRIDNGIGAVQRIGYGTSILEQARDTLAGMSWLNKVPNPMTLVTSMQSFVTLTGTDMGGAAAPSGLRQVTVFRYHSGYYDGVEKQFRGYEGVERQMDSDMSRDAQEPGLAVETYDVGKTDPDFAGKMVKSVLLAGPAGARATLTEGRSFFEKCPVAPATGTFFVCERATTTIITERDPARAVTTRQELDYDGYGQVIRARSLGVIHLGTPEAPMPCAPCMASGVFGDACGPQCLGDEAYAETQFIDPGTAASGNLWLAGSEAEVRAGAVAGTWSQVTRSFYDATDFEAPVTLGRLALGNLTRVEKKLGAGFVIVSRARFDSHGNIVETIDGAGTAADATEHRRLSVYEANGLHLAQVEVRVGSADVDAIKQDFRTDPTWEVQSQSSNWYPTRGGVPLQAAQQTRYRYDEHGRLSSVLLPGDTDALPTTRLTYELADPTSRILTVRRSGAAGSADLVEARCLDGRGRVFQRREQLSASRWQVSGFMEFDARAQLVRRYQPYLATSGACEVAPPAGVPFTRFTYDPSGRKLSETEPDGAVRRSEYGPLVTRSFDERDADATDPFTNTPDVKTFDGLGRLTSTSRQLQSGGPLSVNSFGYDALGLLYSVRDAAANVRTQTSDEIGRVVRVDDTNSGATAMVYDLKGNLLSSTDARGVTMTNEYDGANRLVARYDPSAAAATRLTYRYDYLSGCGECTNTGNRFVQATWPGATAAGEDRAGYDARGNAVFSERTIAGQVFVTRRRFDVAQRLIGVAHPDGTSFESTLDGAGRATSVTGAVSAVEYNERGRLAKVRFVNGTSTEYAYDGRVRLKSATTLDKSGASLMALDYTRSASGEITAVDDGAIAGRLRRGVKFTLDAWSRMTKAELPSAADTETIDYTFDDLDNVTRAVSSRGASSRAHVGDYAYGGTSPNRVTTAGTASFSYDQAGGLLSRNDRTYTRDFKGRLVGVSSPSGQSTSTFNDGERVAKEERDATTWYVTPDFEVRDGITVSYARLNGTRVLRSESDALAHRMLSDLAPATGPGTLTVSGDSKIDIADAWLAQGVSAGVVQLSGGPVPSSVGGLLRSAARRLLLEEATWLHDDHLGSAVLATNADGTLRGERSFYPTGAVREEQGFVDNKGFTNQELDQGTGLIHFQFRELDPLTGRWDRPDPLFLVLSGASLSMTGEFNTGYAYVGNRYGDAIDPTGLARMRANMMGPRRQATAAVGRGVVRGGKYVGKKAVAGGKYVGEKAMEGGKFLAKKARESSATKADVVGGVLQTAAFLATMISNVQNFMGQTDEENGKLAGLSTTTTVLSTVSGVYSMVRLGQKAQAAAGQSTEPKSSSKLEPLQRRSTLERQRAASKSKKEDEDSDDDSDDDDD